MRPQNWREGDLGSLILFTIAFAGVGFGCAIICTFDFIDSGWNIWSKERLLPVAIIAASVLALVWRYQRYHRYKEAINNAVRQDYKTSSGQQDVWPPPPRPPDQTST